MTVEEMMLQNHNEFVQTLACLIARFEHEKRGCVDEVTKEYLLDLYKTLEAWLHVQVKERGNC